MDSEGRRGLYPPVITRETVVDIPLTADANCEPETGTSWEPAPVAGDEQI